MRKYKQAIQIGNNITDIFNLPCVKNVIKSVTGKAMFTLDNGKDAYSDDWLLQDVCDNWHVMTDEEYQKHKDDEV